MAGRAFLMLAVIVMCLRMGQSMQCYSYTCHNFTNTEHPTCAPPKIITCPVDHLSPLPPNRCMTQRMTAELKGTVVNQEIRGCTDNLKCVKNQLCEEAKMHGNIKHCEATCCEGSLCNREGPVARHIAADPMAPSGTDLSCYACSTPNEPGQPAAINCSHPIRQQCGDDTMTMDKQDRCVTIKMSSRGPLGHTLYQEMRHCAAGHYCGHGFCVHANISGLLTSCEADCCFGNMCNNEGMKPSVTSTLVPTTAVREKEVFALQGDEGEISTVRVVHTSSAVVRTGFGNGLQFVLVFCAFVVII